MIDMKKPLEISQVKWVSAQSALAPTNYKILTSLDGNTWKVVKQVGRHQRLAEGTSIVDTFPSDSARFVKMEILGTFGNDGPEIKEFEVVQSQFASLDNQSVKKLEENPFQYVKSQSDYNLAAEYIQKDAFVKLYWKSDADLGQDPNKYIKIPIFVDGINHPYKVQLPAAGLFWKSFTLGEFNFPAVINLSQPKLEYLSVKSTK